MNAAAAAVSYSAGGYLAGLCVLAVAVCAPLAVQALRNRVFARAKRGQE